MKAGKSNLLTRLAQFILSGNRATTAANHRTTMNDVYDSYLNIVDGGNVIEAETGYATNITPSDNKSFATKKYVDDKRTAIESLENKTYNLSDNTIVATQDQLNSIVSPNFFLFANPRVYSTNYDASMPLNLDAYDVYEQTAITGPTTIENPLGGTQNFRSIWFRFTAAGTQTITWSVDYIDGITSLPTSTVAGESLYVRVDYNSTLNKFQCVYVNTGGGGGSGTVNSGTANQLAYYASTGTAVSGLSTSANGILVTDGSSVPSISQTLPSAVQSNIIQTGTLTSGATGTGFTIALGASTITGDLPLSNLTQGSALSVLGVSGNATSDFASISAGTDNQVLRRSGTTLGFGAINLASSNAVTGTLPVANTEAKLKGTLPATNNCVVRSNGTADTAKADTGFTFDGSAMMVNVASAIARLRATGSPQTLAYQMQNSVSDVLASFNVVVNTGAVSVGGTAAGYFTVLTSGSATERWRIDWANGCFSNTGSDGAAWLHLKAGTTTIAPMRLTSAALKTSSNAAGDVQFLTDKLYITLTTGTAVKEVTINDSALTSGTIPVATTNGRLTNGPISVSGSNASFSANVIIASPTSGLEYRSGANQRVGTATLSGGTVTVSNTTVTANTLVKHFRVTPGSGIQGHVSYTKINGTSFTLNSSEATDDGIIGYELIELV